MKEFEIAIKDGILHCKEDKKGVEIARFEGEATSVEIPAGIYSIGKKAFLSCKEIRSITVPEDVEEISDWAFAYCDNLKDIYLPQKQMYFGRGIFRECYRLQHVYVTEKASDVGGLMAAAVTLLDAPFLFDPVEAGSPDWISKWDTRMLQLLKTDDHEGFSKMLLCGEEDYGSKENNLDYFLAQKRKAKVRICFMRLLHPIGLTVQMQKILEDYLREHTSLQASDETWQVLVEEYGEDSRYYKLFTEIGCLTKENFDVILQGCKETQPEMKAFFMKYKDEKIGYQNFFDDLTDF